MGCGFYKDKGVYCNKKIDREMIAVKVNIYHLIEGARQAKGLVVIIDVFRAFSLECYLYSMKVKGIRPVKTIEEAFSFREKGSEYVLVGEREGKMCEGFDFGNSPSSLVADKIKGKMIIHTTSAGTQGIVNAVGADEIITGSLVNASAVARYIKKKNPEEVSLVCMGTGGKVINKEDELCAEYIKSMLMGEPISDIDERVKALKSDGGEHFFDPNNQEVFPEKDFWMCIDCDKFNFVIKVERDELGFFTRPEYL